MNVLLPSSLPQIPLRFRAPFLATKTWKLTSEVGQDIVVQVNVVGTRASKKTVEKESERISLPYLTRTIENRWKFLALLPLHGYIVAFHCLAASVDRCSCLDESVKMLGPLSPSLHPVAHAGNRRIWKCGTSSKMFVGSENFEFFS